MQQEHRKRIICSGNRQRINATREAIGAMKYKAQ